MIAACGYEGKTVAVFGLGGSGLSVVRSLKAGGASVHAWDDKAEHRAGAVAEGAEAVDLLAASDWSAYAALILAPGVPLTHPEPHRVVTLANAAGVPVIGDVELYFQAVAASGKAVKIVAITGTNGKSTTTALIGHMARECGLDTAVGGNIGEPVLSLPEPADGRVYVVELSSYQIDLTPSLKPDVGILLNITPDHIDRHGSLEGYAAVKEKMFARMGNGGTAIVGQDDDLCRDIGDRVQQNIALKFVPISVEAPLVHGVFVSKGRLFEVGSGLRRDVAALDGLKTLKGAHNWQNALAAYAAGRALGLKPRDILAAFDSFPGLAHRMEIVREEGALTFVNDSKATNADAAAKALAAYDNIYWIAGGRAKAGGIASLEPLFGHIREAFLIGECEADFAATLEGKLPFVRAGTLDSAVAQAAEAARANGGKAVILLSPACASFDQFTSFEARGDAFRAAVERLYEAGSEARCA